METVAPQKHPLDWINISFLVLSHALGVVGIIYLCRHFHWATLTLGLVWLTCTSMSITGGYHRLFSHRAYNAHAIVKWFYLLFGAASVQNSVLNWAADHRVHHKHTDHEQDPYNIKKGFWWAHMGWVCYRNPAPDYSGVKDLAADRLVSFQHRYYLPLAFLVGWGIPTAIASSWGDPWGGFLVAGFTRVAVQYQSTFSINSIAHYIGTQPYAQNNSARDSIITAIFTWGEGYHNYHHRFPTDYRNGIRAYHFDPSKWFVWCLSHLGLTYDLRRTPDTVIAKALQDSKQSS